MLPMPSPSEQVSDTIASGKIGLAAALDSGVAAGAVWEAIGAFALGAGTLIVCWHEGHVTCAPM